MTWKTMEIEQLGISNGLALGVAQKLKVKNCGELAEAMTAVGEESGIAVIKKSYGEPACDIIIRELMNVSKGEFDSMIKKPAATQLDSQPAAESQDAPPATLPSIPTAIPPTVVSHEQNGLQHVVAGGKVEVVKNVGDEKLNPGDVVEAAGDKKDGATPVKKTKAKKEEQADSGTVKLAATTLTAEVEIDKLKALRQAADKILKQRDIVKASDSEFDRCKTNAKDAKKEKDKQRDLLVEMLEELTDNQPRLPGMSSLKEEKPAAAEAATDVPSAEALNDQPASDGDWRKESVTVLMGDGVARGTLTKLTEAGINTMGDLQQAFLENRVYTIDGLGKAKADKVREKAFEWFNTNKPNEEIDTTTQIRLVKDLEDCGRVILEAGAIVTRSLFRDGRVGCVHNGVVIALTTDQWEPVEKPKMIQITKAIAGTTPEDKLDPGCEVEVIKWYGRTAVVKCPGTQREATIAPSEFEAL